MSENAPEPRVEPAPLPPQRRSFGLLWSMLAVGVLVYLLWFHQPQESTEPASPEWIAEQREFLQGYSLKEGVILKESGLMIRHIQEGSGQAPNSDSMITVHYSGSLTNGTVFDRSHDHGRPITFPLAQVIPGWRQAFPLLKEGGKAELVIPAELAYGATARGRIPAQSALIFEVELLKVE